MSLPAGRIDTEYTLDHRYTRQRGRVFLTGIQALVRLPMMQVLRDRAADLNTGGFISGYRGSPLGGVDLNLWRARHHLQEYGVEFVAGLNEDLAATAVWGSQQVNLWPGATVDGVFGMWYGKGPGVDRCGDVFKHANAAGTSPHGGVLVLAGDDHAARSSTVPHQSEHEFIAAMMPVLYPASVQDILDMGLLGWAMSRFTGRWVGFKTIAETVESSASVYVNPHQLEVRLPDDFELPQGGLNIRWPDERMVQEERLHRYGLPAARAFVRANGIDRLVIDSDQPRLGIVTAGKSHLDVMQSLADLGIDRRMAADIGIRVYKVGMPWPLEPVGIRRFADGLEEILVVEEKRAIVEKQLKEQMYNWDSDSRPVVVGKRDETGEWVLPSIGELTPARVAQVIARRLERFFSSDAIHDRVRFLQEKEKQAGAGSSFQRVPYFCSGCPHNTSTRVPDGSRAVAGIGCHFMAGWMGRNTETFTQMGGEGTPWIGQAPFTETRHIFVNLGDGTYFHSGILAIRACIAARSNITFKILYNDAVAMTGGQPVDGTLTVPDIAQQVRAEGVDTIVVMSDEIEKWSEQTARFPLGVRFEDRGRLDPVQRELREASGVTVLIYDQTCAAEKRRRRKRGLMADPPKRAFINHRVCEGCGDCGVQSNCLSIIPRETELGRKRAIDQSSCNKDFSCVNGFCPSFVTVHGGRLRRRQGRHMDLAAMDLPKPDLPELFQPYGIVVTGIGGTGVVTIGALLGMAAHLENKGVTVLDQTGLAQKGGAVTSHVKIAADPRDIHAVRVAAGSADLILGCDNVVAAGDQALAKVKPGRTRTVINTHQTMPGTFTGDADLAFPGEEIRCAIVSHIGEDHVHPVNATALARTLLGDSIGSNLFMLGFAWQKGLIPVSEAALDRAIELNGVAVESNRHAFAWGRMAAADPDAVATAAGLGKTPAMEPAGAAERQMARRLAFLTDYQNAAYASRWQRLVDRAAAAEKERAPGLSGLAEAVAESYFRLLAIKDEYEVARLYTDGEFTRELAETFDGNYSLRFHLAPPVLAPRDPDTGQLKKREFGGWIMPVLRVLALLRRIRGSWLDPFGFTDERRMERRLQRDYESCVSELLRDLDHDNHGLAVEIAALPGRIRGFGHVKERSRDDIHSRQSELMERFRFKHNARAA